MVSCLPSTYHNAPELDSDRVDLRVVNVPDIRYEVTAAIQNQNVYYFPELRRHQNIMAFNICSVLLAILKLFKRHEILQFQYLRSLLLDNNAIVVLLKMIPHPWSDEEKYGAMMLQPQSYRTLNVDQFLKRFYPKKSVSISMLNSNSTTSRVVTVKVNALRIIQKCIKHSLGHCRLLSHGLHCHEWMVRFSGDKNP